MVEIFNKLVRDRIPEIIRSQGDVPKTEILNNNNYFAALNQKLEEEVAEYLEDYSVDELADIVEVIFAIVKFKGLDVNEFEALRLKKHKERGGFDSRISLLEVIHE